MNGGIKCSDYLFRSYWGPPWPSFGSIILTFVIQSGNSSFTRFLTAVIILPRSSWCSVTTVLQSECFRTVTACPEIVPRADWGAAAAVNRVALTSLPVPYVVIHHTFQPGFCNTSHTCKAAMRSMQNYHQNTKQWSDIGYQWVSTFTLCVTACCNQYTSGVQVLISLIWDTFRRMDEQMNGQMVDGRAERWMILWLFSNVSVTEVIQYRIRWKLWLGRKRPLLPSIPDLTGGTE